MISLMTVSIHQTKTSIKKRKKYSCPYCHAPIEINFNEIEQSKQRTGGLYTTCYLHGDPLHAFILYIDSDGKVRGHEIITNIFITKESETLNTLLKKWAKG